MAKFCVTFDVVGTHTVHVEATTAEEAAEKASNAASENADTVDYELRLKSAVNTRGILW